MKRKSTLSEKKVFLFLNSLRESGKTNMFGATPYIQKKFKYGHEESLRILKLWMHNFSADGNYEEITEKEIAA